MKDMEYIGRYLGEVSSIASRISKEDIEGAIQILYDAWREGKKVFLIGNGGSASTATHFACDLSKYCSVNGKRRFRAVALTDNPPLISALTNDEGWENVYYYQLQNLLDDGDGLVVFSVHGGSGSDKAGLWSQNLLKAAKYVQDRGGKVLGFSGFDGGALKQIADRCIVVPANSTPHVEGFHVVLTHLLADGLRQKIDQSSS